MQQKGFNRQKVSKLLIAKKIKYYLIRVYKKKSIISSTIQEEEESDEDQVKPLQVVNIFTQLPSENEFKHEKGPKYDKHGDIQKYTLVGKADWFTKCQHQGKRGTYFDDVNIKHISRQSDEKSMYNRKQFDMQSTNKKLTASEKKQFNRTKEQLRTKNQVLDEIDSIRGRLRMNQMKEDEEIEDLPEGTKKYFLKQKEFFNQHQEHQETWQKFIQLSASKLERDGSYSQLCRADGFRSRLEAAQTFDVLKSDFDRFGSRVWYNTLRKNESYTKSLGMLKLNNMEIQVENEQKVPLIMNEDIPNAFRYSSLGGMKSTIEYIRKPQCMENQTFYNQNSLSSSNVLQQTSQSIPFTSFRSDKYLQEKMSVYEKEFTRSHMVSFDRLNDLDQLFITGKSQFEAECDVVYKDKRDNMGLYKKYIDKQLPTNDEIKQNDSQIASKGQPKDQEEIIISSYSKLHKLKLPSLQKKGLKKMARSDSLRSSLTHVSGMNLSRSD